MAENPLFRSFSRHLREEAKSAFSRTSIGQLLTVARGDLKHGPKSAEIFRKMKAASNQRPNELLRQLMGTNLGGVVRTVERYAKGGSASKAIINQFLDAIGPAGSIIKLLAGSLGVGGGKKTKLESDLAAAVQLVQAHGGVVLPSKALARKLKSTQTSGPFSRSVQGATQFLENMGVKTVLPELVDESPDDEETITQGPTERRSEKRDVKIRLGPGRTRLFPSDHPIVTGEFIQTPDSSNVYAYAYERESGSLYVRFKAPAKHDGPRPQKPGSLYKYSHFPVTLFLQMMAAGSVGEFVWDHIRVRGTVSGHQYDYALVAVTGSYVPRKAVLTAAGEAFVKRRILTHRDRVLVSSRPNQFLSGEPWSPNRAFPKGPNRGTPNRGKP